MKNSKLKINTLVKPFEVLPDELMANISSEAFRVLMWMRMMDYNAHAASSIHEKFLSTHYKGDAKSETLVSAITELAQSGLYWDGELFNQRYKKRPTGFAHIDNPKENPAPKDGTGLKQMNLKTGFSLRSGRCKYTTNFLKTNADDENLINMVIWKHKLLSYKTKEIFQYCYDNADEGVVAVTDDLLKKGYTAHAISKAFKELIQYGFARRVQGRASGNKFDNVYYELYDVPEQNPQSFYFIAGVQTWDDYYYYQINGNLLPEHDRGLPQDFYDLHPEIDSEESLHPETKVCTRSLHPEFAPGTNDEEPNNDGHLQHFLSTLENSAYKESLHPEFAPGSLQQINELCNTHGGNIVPAKVAYIYNNIFYKYNEDNRIEETSNDIPSVTSVPVLSKKEEYIKGFTSLRQKEELSSTEDKVKSEKKKRVRSPKVVDMSFLQDLNDENDPKPKFHDFVQKEYPFVFKTFLRDDMREKYNTRWIMSDKCLKTLTARYSQGAIVHVLNSIESRDGDTYMDKYKDLYRVLLNWGVKAQIDVNRLAAATKSLDASDKYLKKADAALEKQIGPSRPKINYGSLN